MTPPTLIFRQLFDRESCTYTYILGESCAKEAVIIDPVIDHVQRDLQLVKELGLNLKYALNTHVHADHITGSGKLKNNSETKSGISKASGASADLKLDHGDLISFGSFTLEVRATPGHTNGCLCYLLQANKMVFTGDTLLIRGCGRTDFQEGSAKKLYESVHSQLFTLPDDFIVYPAHDYKGNSCSSIGEEKKFNPRLTKSLNEFESIMASLNLPRPKMIDEAVPANKVCGLYNLPEIHTKL